MSSIFGLIDFDKENITSAETEKLAVWNSPYGNDVCNTVFIKNGFLGANINHFSNSPMAENAVVKKDNLYAVVDSVIYNREELLAKMADGASLPDEELLVEYVIKYGFSSLADVNGDFAGVIFDSLNGTITAFRDHMGVRPLFYYYSGNYFVFSTDIRGIVATKDVDVSVNEEWLYKSLMGYPVNGLDNTEFENIKCVLPGTFVTLKKDSPMECEQYWSLGRKRIRYKSFEEYRDKLKELITDSVKRRLDVVDGVVGSELSGGLDSGVISILINRLGRECRFFSWSPDEKDIPFEKGDERVIVKDICDQEGITCDYRDLYFPVKVDSRMVKFLRETGIDVYPSNNAEFRSIFPSYIDTFPVYATSEFLAQKGVRIIFTGHGGDEGVSHRLNPYEIWYHHDYSHFFKTVWDICEGRRFRPIRTLLTSRDILKKERKMLGVGIVGEHGDTGILNSDFVKRLSNVKVSPNQMRYDVIDYINDGGSRKRLDVVSLFGGFAGVQYVIPYLDFRVVDYAVSIPRYLYRKGKVNRYIFREAFKDIMPSSLYTLELKTSNSKLGIKKKVQEKEAGLSKEEEQKQKEAMYASVKEMKDFYREGLDLKFWEKYLDAKKLSDFFDGKAPENDEELAASMQVLDTLLVCFSHENLKKLVRS